MTILITGGAGFIGSHMAGFLLEKHIDFIVLDNFSNSNLTNIKILEREYNRKINIIEADLRIKKDIEKVFINNHIDSVIHFAALKSVEESELNKNLYYSNNVVGSINLLDCIKLNNIKTFIFSSSACVYGEPAYLPMDENHPIKPLSQYGKNKVDIENFLKQDNYFLQNCKTIILRYFNPIGSFTNGLIGENLIDIPNNLMPYIMGVATKKFPFLKIYGDDFDTEDGTAIRDYIHIMDLVEAHFFALETKLTGLEIFNVGTGNGYSVKQIVKTFEQVNTIKIPFEVHQRRPGDVVECYSNSNKINSILGWKAKRDLKQMCEDSYKFAIQFVNN